MADDLRPIQVEDTRAPRGAGPLRLEWSDVIAMNDAGLFGEIDRPELVDGEIVIMPFEGPLHRMALQVLQRWLLAVLTSDFELSVRASLQVLGTTTYFIPDLAILKAGFVDADCSVAKAELIIEVSDTTLAFDLGKKCQNYAQAGAKEYWVVDIKGQCIIAHREPAGQSFGWVRTFKAGQIVTPACLDGHSFDPATLPNPADFV
jgi:Uma2 family endonuclease